MPPLTVVTVVGARPQFVKAAVVGRALARRGVVERILHTGQHYDDNMSEVFFRELSLPAPDWNLGLGRGPHGAMTGRMLEGIEAILAETRPDWVLVHGDTNSTLAGALAATKLGLRVAHVEAGLRSFNRRMPEEVNRTLTDHAADLLFAPTEAAVRNLRAEGIDSARIARVGDVMLDAMLHYRARAAGSDVLDRLALTGTRYGLATVHRAENTDDPARLRGIMAGLAEIAEVVPIVMPLHPRTRRALDGAEVGPGISLIEPVGYLDMIKLESHAALVATDSGGVQKEAYFNGVPCVTLRDETEWVELVEAGANALAGTDPDRIAAAGRRALGRSVTGAALYGDGRAGDAIAERLLAER